MTNWLRQTEQYDSEASLNLCKEVACQGRHLGRDPTTFSSRDSPESATHMPSSFTFYRYVASSCVTIEPSPRGVSRECFKMAKRSTIFCGKPLIPLCLANFLWHYGLRQRHDNASYGLSCLEIYANLQSPKTPKSMSDKVPSRSVIRSYGENQGPTHYAPM
ncbi:hypothetical protein TNCV_3177301 [Trichonephila clavipes]|nr:hypothetical protein TNCV_3177301 [Trichonephila clavipes]